MNCTVSEKIFHQLHHCMNLLRRGHGHGRSHGEGHGHGHNHGEGHGHDRREGGGDCGRHRGQGRVISLLRQEHDGISQRDLVELLNIRPSSLSEMLDKLESHGLIERRQHETDKRVSNVFITEKGRDAAAHAEEARQKSADTLLAALEPQEQESLSTLLGKVIGSLEAGLGDAEERHCCGHHGGKRHGKGCKHGDHGHGDHGHGRHHHRGHEEQSGRDGHEHGGHHQTKTDEEA